MVKIRILTRILTCLFRQLVNKGDKKWTDLFHNESDMVSIAKHKKSIVNKKKHLLKTNRGINSNQFCPPKEKLDVDNAPELLKDSLDHNDDKVFLRPTTIELDTNSNHVVVWTKGDDTEKNNDGLLHQKYSTTTQDIRPTSLNQDMRSPIKEKDTQEFHKTILGSEIDNHDLRNKPKTSDHDITSENISIHVDARTKKNNKKKAKGDVQEMLSDKPMQMVSNYAYVGDVDNLLPEFMKSVTQLIFQNLNLDCANHQLEISFDFDIYDKILSPIRSEFSVLKQAQTFDFIISFLIRGFQKTKFGAEYCRRAFNLLYQFQQEMILKQWISEEHNFCEESKAVATLLKVEERWPLFSDFDEHTWYPIENRLKTFDEEKNADLRTIFVNHQHRYRISTIKLVVEAKMKHYTFSFSAKELEHSMKLGYCIPLVLKLDLALELSLEDVVWTNLTAEQTEKKLASVYSSMKGETVENGVAYSLLPVLWLSSPVRELILKKHSHLNLFENRIKLLISLSKAHAPVKWDIWTGQTTSEAWGEELLNGAETVAATYTGIQLESLAQLKHLYRKRLYASTISKMLKQTRNTSKGKRQGMMTKVKEQYAHPILNLNCWPKSKLEEKDLPENVLAQRDLFVKYFRLLDIPINP